MRQVCGRGSIWRKHGWRLMLLFHSGQHSICCYLIIPRTPRAHAWHFAYSYSIFHVFLFQLWKAFIINCGITSLSLFLLCMPGSQRWLFSWRAGGILSLASRQLGCHWAQAWMLQHCLDSNAWHIKHAYPASLPLCSLVSLSHLWRQQRKTRDRSQRAQRAPVKMEAGQT